MKAITVLTPIRPSDRLRDTAAQLRVRADKLDRQAEDLDARPYSRLAPVGSIPFDRICLDCHHVFTVQPGELAWLRVRGLQMPRRCKPCRDAIREYRRHTHDDNQQREAR